MTKHEIDMYEGVNPCVRDYFNRTFNASFNFPKFGFGVGGALFLFASVSNFSVPSRLVLFTVPVLLDALQRSRDTKSEIKTT